MVTNIKLKVIFLLEIAFFILLFSNYIFAQLVQKKDYIVGPNDVLDIKVWDHEDLNRVVEVSQEISEIQQLTGEKRLLDWKD